MLGLLGGCFNYDAAPSEVVYHNYTDSGVVVSILGADRPFGQTLPPMREGGQDAGLPIDECVGTGILVETADGDLVGRVDQQACPGWVLTINEDRSLTYEER